MPIQQIARTVKTYGYDSENEDFAVLNEVFVDIENLCNVYVPVVADNCKNSAQFRSDVLSSDPVKYAKAWIKLGLKYPKTYIEAFLFQNYGYWYTDVEYWTAYYAVDYNEYDLYMRPEYNSLREALADLHSDFSINSPAAIITSPGFICWIIMLSAAILILKQKSGKSSVLLILIGIWFTTLASPVFCEFRYIYGLFTSAPIVLIYSIYAEQH